MGDLVLFYHSNCKPPGVVGIAKICKEAYFDFTAWDPKSKYYDPKSPEEKPRWMMVDVEFVEKFSDTVSLNELKTYPQLEEMLVIRKGMRLSVQPVEKKHFDFVCRLAKKK